MDPDERQGAPTFPLAYFITFTCHGTWLTGDERGSVDRRHNEPGTPFLPDDSRRREAVRQRMTSPPYSLDATRRPLVLRAIREVCAYRGWHLHAMHVRPTHVHIVVSGEATPERMMNDFKAYASRALNAARVDPPEVQRWTRHGSTRYIWKADHLAACVHYTLHEQGEPLEVYEDDPSRER